MVLCPYRQLAAAKRHPAGRRRRAAFGAGSRDLVDRGIRRDQRRAKDAMAGFRGTDGMSGARLLLIAALWTTN
jgi:hypothetical protein